MTKRTPRRSPPTLRELEIERGVIHVVDRTTALGNVTEIRIVPVSVAKVRALTEGPRA